MCRNQRKCRSCLIYNNIASLYSKNEKYCTYFTICPRIPNPRIRIEELSFGLRFHLFNSIYYFMPTPTFHFDYELNIWLRKLSMNSASLLILHLTIFTQEFDLILDCSASELVTVMLVTTWCWWYHDDDSLKMLAKSLCWWLF